MALTLNHNDLRIEIFDDSAFNESADSPTSYNKVLQVEKDKPYSPNAQHAVKIYKADQLVNSAIILASGGGTGVHSDSALIDQENLIIRCCNKIFSLTLTDLDMNWVTEADWATCFSIHRYKDTYISYGEMQIARIDRAGKFIWTFSGKDIFVRLNHGNPFEMHDEFIDLMDFEGNTYRINYDGQTLNYKKSEEYHQKLLFSTSKPKKPWWKFFI